MPCCEVMLMIRPRASPRDGWVSICRIAARQSRNGPRRFTAMIASKSSSPVSSSGLEWAPASTALLTSTSRLPARSTARATSRSQSSRAETSARTYSHAPPSSAMSSSVGVPPVSGSRRTSASSTQKPSAASREAIARPIPEEEPVTIAERATRPSIGRGYTRSMDRRGVAFVAHCLLNQNSKVGDGAHCGGIYSPVVDVLREKGWRIEQMPCPELAFTGLNRFWAVREQLDTAAYRRHCRRLAAAVAGMIAVRARRGEDIVLIGVQRSPSMGVHITSSDPARGGLPEGPGGTAGLTSGGGIFVEELREELGRRGIVPGLGGETHALPDHDELTQQTRLVSLLDRPREKPSRTSPVGQAE